MWSFFIVVSLSTLAQAYVMRFGDTSYPSYAKYSPYSSSYAPSYGYSQDLTTSDFQVSEFLSKRLESIVESAYSYSLLAPQEQAELMTIIRNSYLSRDTLYQQMSLFGSKLAPNKRYYYDKWVNRLQEIMAEFNSYAQQQQSLLCTTESQQYCSELIQIITDQSISFFQAEQKIQDLMNRAPVSGKTEFENAVRALDQYLLRRLKERRMIYRDPLAAVVYSPTFGQGQGQATFAMSLDNNVYRPSYLSNMGQSYGSYGSNYQSYGYGTA